AIPHKVTADRARTALSALYSWAIEGGRASVNPTMHVASRAKNGSRKRTLSEAELAEVWSTCLDDDHGRIVRLLILTGQRRGEIGGLEWSEVNREERMLELPALRCKNNRDHIVPLTDEAFAVLPAEQEERKYVFGRGAGPFSGWSKAKAELD